MLISLSVILIAGLNLLSAGVIGRAENWIVGLKVAIQLIGVEFTQMQHLTLDRAVRTDPRAFSQGIVVMLLATSRAERPKTGVLAKAWPERPHYGQVDNKLRRNLWDWPS